MFQRLTHAAVAFAVTALLYQIYVLAVTPFVEPTSYRALRTQQFAVPRAAGGNSRFHACLAAYFPPDHWSFAKPVTLDNGQLVALLDAAYRETDDGKVRVEHCVFIYFPRPRDNGGPAQPDAIVVEAIGGAVLQLDSPAGVAGGGWDEIQHGQLVGPVVLRSDMRNPGPEDDLQLIARDVWINRDLIRSTEAVQLKLGPHFARGRKLEIRLMSDHSAGDSRLPLQGLESLEISYDVFVEIAPDADSANLSPPIRVQSNGPFAFDFGSFKASFSDDVRARQLHPSGELDELQADELNLFFDPTGPRNGRDAKRQAGKGRPATADSSLHELARLQPRSIEVRGEPAILTAPSRKAAAQGRRLWLEIPQRRIHVEGGEEVRLVYDGHEVHAPLIIYEHPADGAPERLGTLLAAGRGWLRREANATSGAGELEVLWRDQISVERRDGQPVLTLSGRPVATLGGGGQIWADRLELTLREAPPDAENASREDAEAAHSWPIYPEYLAASGSVAIDSTTLAARVDRLNVQFAVEPLNGPHDRSTAAPRSGFALLGEHSERDCGAREAGPARRYAVSGSRLDIKTALRGRTIEPREIIVQGGVVFEEESSTASNGGTLRVTAEKVHVASADAPDAQIFIQGGAAPTQFAPASTSGSGVRLAEVSTAGATLRAESLTIKRGTSEASIEAPGEVQLMVGRDLGGKPLERPEPLAIRWTDSMRLRGREIEFRGRVVAEHPLGQLQTPRLVAKLSSDVRFDALATRQRPELERIECWEGAIADVTQSDATGTTARHRVELQSIAVNQISGDISGRGPGQIESAHLARQSNFWQMGRAQSNAAEPSSAQQLKYLGVEFMRAVTGNLHRRQLELSGDARAVYGPIDAWEQRLATTPGAVKNPQTFWISSDQLEVFESPSAAITSRPTPSSLGPLELAARGRVYIEGEDPRKGAFYAQAQRAAFDQAKSIFVLEGDGRSPAKIAHQPYVGAPLSESSYQKLIYSLKTGDISANRAEIELLQLDGRARPSP